MSGRRSSTRLRKELPMTSYTRSLAAAAAISGLSAPLAAQNPYPYGYPQQGYGQNPVGQIIDQLLGNRYNVTDRQAVSRCASAAMVQAQNQYRGYDYSQRYGSPQGYGYPQGIAAPAMRVT